MSNNEFTIKAIRAAFRNAPGSTVQEISYKLGVNAHLVNAAINTDKVLYGLACKGYVAIEPVGRFPAWYSRMSERTRDMVPVKETPMISTPDVDGLNPEVAKERRDILDITDYLIHRSNLSPRRKQEIRGALTALMDNFSVGFSEVATTVVQLAAALSDMDQRITDAFSSVAVPFNPNRVVIGS